MICPNCQTIFQSAKAFCANCGANLSQAGNQIGDTNAPTESFPYPPPTIEFSHNSISPPQFAQQSENTPSLTQSYTPSNSLETIIIPSSQFGASEAHNFASPVSSPSVQPQTANTNKKLFAWIGAISTVLLAAGLGGFVLLSKYSLKTEILPEHLGMFVQNKEKNKIEEIKKQDFANALDGTDKLLKDDNLINAEGSPNLLLYSDGKDVPLNDLRLIQLDTIKPDGTVKQIDFQAAPVEGKPEIKRIRIPEGLANSKYAFAILDGFLDEGKHKFWAFQVKNSEKTNNDAALKSSTVSLKPKQEKTDKNTKQTSKPVVPPPTGTYAYSTINRLIVRDSPSLSGGDTGIRISKDQRVYVQSHSSHTDTWKGRTGKWAYINTDDGISGWVFTPLLKY